MLEYQAKVRGLPHLHLALHSLRALGHSPTVTRVGAQRYQLTLMLPDAPHRASAKWQVRLARSSKQEFVYDVGFAGGSETYRPRKPIAAVIGGVVAFALCALVTAQVLPNKPHQVATPKKTLTAATVKESQCELDLPNGATTHDLASAGFHIDQDLNFGGKRYLTGLISCGNPSATVHYRVQLVLNDGKWKIENAAPTK